MGRVYKELQTNGKKAWTLFDTGSRNTYVVSSAAQGMSQLPTAQPRRVALGGKIRTLNLLCTFSAIVEGKALDLTAFVIDELGVDEKGRPIEILFGALEMQRWGITPVPVEEKLDLSHYPEEFIEY
jgi:hypothetical protein